MKIKSFLKRFLSPLSISQIMALVFLFLLIGSVLVFFGQLKTFLNQSELFRYQIGDIALQDYYIQQDLVIEDRYATDKRKKMKEALVHPVYIRQQRVSEQVQADFQLFSSLLINLLSEEIPQNVLKEELSDQFPGILSDEVLSNILRQEDITEILAVSLDALTYVMDQAVLGESLDRGKVPSGIIDVVEEDGTFESRQSYLSETLLYSDRLEGELLIFLGGTSLSSMHWDLAITLVTFFHRQNCFYSESLSQYSLEQALSEVESVIIRYSRGDLFLARGTLITGENLKKIQAIQEQKRSISLLFVLETAIYLIIVFTAVGIFFSTFQLNVSSKNVWLMISFSAIFTVITALILALVRTGEGVYTFFLVPIALFGILLSQLTVDSKASMVLVSAFSFIVFYLSEMDFRPFLYMMIVGNISCLVTNRAKKRIDMILSAVIMAVIQGGVSLVLYMFFSGFSGMIRGIFWSCFTGFMAGLFSLALIPLFELFFNYCTTFRLVELSDHTAPVLKRMLTMAPGTYVHSLNVANLAESACQEIGANSLLARIGAYYHDIGKIDQSEYFIENQNQGVVNKHDDIKASLSAAVIKSHVKVGAEKGRELRLPQEVIDIIVQHHGTSTIHYFYKRAMEEKNNSKINIDDFRHSGPKPQSKEAAVVMLSDITEAATRTLKKPTVSKLEKMIWDLIMDRFQIGELNECDLTLKDLEDIKNSFVKVLAGHFHTRIEYPGQREEYDDE